MPIDRTFPIVAQLPSDFATIAHLASQVQAAAMSQVNTPS